MNHTKIEQAFLTILDAIGEDPKRPDLQETPSRMASLYADLFAGLHKDPCCALHPFQTQTHDDWIVVRDIPFLSMCEHHFLPFSGTVQVAYLPQQQTIVGFGDLFQLVDILAKRLQIQERFSAQIADTLVNVLQPKGVLIHVSAQHSCTIAEGIKPGAKVITATARGCCDTSDSVYQMVLTLMDKN